MKTVLNYKVLDPRKQPMFLGEQLGLQRYDRLKYPVFFKLAQSQEGFFWRAEEIPLSKDRQDYKALTDTERFVFDTNLKWQTATDSMLNRSITKMMEYVSLPELEACMSVWAFFESNIHSRSYSHILKNIYPDESVFWDSILTDPEILKRMDSIKQSYDALFSDDDTDIRTKIFNAVVATNVTESVSFYVSFACSFYFGVRGKMEGNAKIIRLISRDEDCVDKYTEVLTPGGWKLISDLKESDKVAQVDSNKSLQFVIPNKIISKHYTGNLNTFLSGNKDINMYLTPNHRVVWWNKLGENKECPANEFRIGSGKQILCSGNKLGGTLNTLSNEQRLLIAIQADGSIPIPHIRNGRYTDCNAVTFSLTKERKKVRLENLLNELGYEYTKSDVLNHSNKKAYYVKVPVKTGATKFFDRWVNLEDITQNWCQEFIEELSYWDGSRISEDRFYYSSVVKRNTDIVQAIACMSGYKCHYSTEEDNRKDSYRTVNRLSFLKNKDYMESQCLVPGVLYYSDMVYCVSVPSGMFLARRNGNTFVTGNCHVAITLQILRNMEKNSEEGFQEIYNNNKEKIIDCFRIATEAEKEWAEYLFSKGNLLGLNQEILGQFAEYKCNSRLKALGLKALYPEYKNNPLGSWYSQFLNSEKVQLAAQETALSSYQVGTRDTEINQTELQGLEL